MNCTASFAALSAETWSAVAHFERETGKHLADEIEERDERMVRLFLILHGYQPREISDADYTPSNQEARCSMRWYEQARHEPDPGWPTSLGVIGGFGVFIALLVLLLWR